MGVILNSGFLVKSLIKENYHKSRNSDDMDMKLRPVTKLYNRNKTTSKNFDDDIMSENCGIIIIFLIYGQFGAIRNLDSKSAKLMFSLIVTFYLTKIEKRTKKSLPQLSQYCFDLRYYFCQKTVIFCKKNADISKLKMALVLKVVFSETT